MAQLVPVLHKYQPRSVASLVVTKKTKNVINGTKKVKKNINQETDGYNYLLYDSNVLSYFVLMYC